MTRYANAQTSTQFDPSQYISKKHYKYQKGGAQKLYISYFSIKMFRRNK